MITDKDLPKGYAIMRRFARAEAQRDALVTQREKNAKRARWTRSDAYHLRDEAMIKDIAQLEERMRLCLGELRRLGVIR
jgi:hypothetical protein